MALPGFHFSPCLSQREMKPMTPRFWEPCLLPCLSLQDCSGLSHTGRRLAATTSLLQTLYLCFHSLKGEDERRHNRPWEADFDLLFVVMRVMSSVPQHGEILPLLLTSRSCCGPIGPPLSDFCLFLPALGFHILTEAPAKGLNVLLLCMCSQQHLHFCASAKSRRSASHLGLIGACVQMCFPDLSL